MKLGISLEIAAILTVTVASMLVVNLNPMSAQPQQTGKVEEKFEQYRRAIQDSFQVDIKGFKENLTGGTADGKTITAYDLGELLEGIKFELEHTSDRFVALELAMDHLERIPNYYSRLRKLEREAVSDQLLQM
jgi:Protein of unknown function (DUF5661)